MASIIERKRADGTIAHLVQITIKKDGKIVHREARTFDRRPAANEWARKREKELSAPGGVAAVKTRRVTLADAIDKYMTTATRSFGRTKTGSLTAIKTYDIAAKLCGDITSQDIVAFAAELAEGRQPQTVGNYLSHLGSVFAVAQPAWDYPLDRQAWRDALIVLKRLGATSRSKQRTRRPSVEEATRLVQHFKLSNDRHPDSMPMHKIVAFAIFSTRRQEEITLIRWEDLDEAGSKILVRDMKNPGEKIGNDVWCDLPPEALRVIKAMPKTDDRIFPFDPKTVSANFTRAVALLTIDDLHFHDLRHDGVSRLFEMGWSIPHAAAVSGHRSWSSLKRYTHLNIRAGDKYANWSVGTLIWGEDKQEERP